MSTKFRKIEDTVDDVCPLIEDMKVSDCSGCPHLVKNDPKRVDYTPICYKEPEDD